MTLFGKVLLVFNLLAAGGFVYLATQDWKGRQTIAGTGLRYQLLVEGLPLGGVKQVKGEPDDPDTMPADADAEIPFRMKGPGGVPVGSVSKKLLDAYFQAAPGGEALGGGGAVPNQLAEVKRVWGKVEELVSKAEGAEQVRLLRDMLIYQVETFDERLEVMALADAGNAEALKARLLARFDAVLEAPKAADPASAAKLQDSELEAAASDEERTKLIEAKRAKIAESRSAPLDEGERRARLAHLLVHLNPDPAWQKRVMVVVGLRRYVSAVAAQAPRFRDMSARLEQFLISDQSNFLDQVKGLEQLAREGTERANRQQRLREQWVAQAVKEADLVSQRQTQLDDLVRQLTKIKSEVDAMLVRQTGIEAGLFEVQREVALTLEEVYKLEADLADRERKLLGATPPKN